MAPNSLIMLLSASTAWAAVAPAYYPVASSPPAYQAPATTAPPVADECAAKCAKEWDACRVAPGANMAGCSATYAGCIGYNPFTQGATFVTPTICAKSTTSPTATPSAPKPDECLKKCKEADNACRVAPDANFSLCAANFAACVGYSPYDASGTFVEPTACSAKSTTTPAATPPVYKSAPAPPVYTTSAPPADDCLKKCKDARVACQNAPGANQSLCIANFAACLGYSPFDASGTFVEPTAACSSKTATATATAPAKPATTPTDDCLKKCKDADTTCRVAPDRNFSLCAAKFAACVGYSPYDASGTFVEPTACSSRSASATAPAATNAPAPAPAPARPAGSGTPVAPAAPVQYTGGAALMGGSFLAVAAGAVGLLI